MMQPKETKYRKQQKGRNRGRAKAGTVVRFGQYALKSQQSGRITSRQIESARQVIARKTRRLAKIWITIFPDKPITAKPLEVRQGKGKGNVEYYVALVQEGRILFEIEGITEALAREVFRLATAKLPVKTSFVRREDFHESE